MVQRDLNYSFWDSLVNELNESMGLGLVGKSNYIELALTL